MILHSPSLPLINSVVRKDSGVNLFGTTSSLPLSGTKISKREADQTANQTPTPREIASCGAR